MRSYPGPQSSTFGHRASRYAVAAGLLLAGCRAGPDGAPPDLSTEFPAAFASGTSALRDAEAGGGAEARAEAESHAALDPWWGGFGDPELARLVGRASRESLDLHRLAELVQAARAARGVANAAGQPFLDATGGYDYLALGEDAFVPGGVPGGVETSTYRAGVVAGWELDLWGRIARLTEAADADIAVAAGDLDAARLSLQGAVARAVLDIRAVDARRRVLDATLRLDEESVAVAEARVRVGLAGAIDAARARRVRAANRARLAPLEAARGAAELRLATLLGVSHARPAVAVYAAGQLPAAPPLPALGLPADLAVRRPDLRAAAASYAATAARAGAAQAERYPTLTLSGSFEMQGPSLGDAFNPGARVLGVGPSLRLPLLDGGRIAAAQDAADARQRAALLALRSAAVGAVNEVDQTLDALRFSAREAEQLAAALDSARTAESLARSRYRAGTGEYLDVIEAAGQRLLLEESRIAAQRERLDQSVGLYLALGGAWDAGAAPAAGPPFN